MKYLAIILNLIFLTGCFPSNWRTSYSVEDPTVKGEKNIAQGSMISTTRDRYWASYCNALEKGGYIVYYSQEENPKDDEGAESKHAIKAIDEGFTSCDSFGRDGRTKLHVIGVKETKENNKDANLQLWKDGQVYARTLCSDFFRRIARSYSHRQHARKQTNIAGGFISGAMGLAGVSPDAVGGTSLAFSSAESMFNAYDESFMVTPDLGLMEVLVKTAQKSKSESVNDKDIDHVSDVLTHLNEYVYPCTFTGIQALLDQSLDYKLSDFDEKNIPFGFR
jgi:hypothetical protein